MTCDKTLLAITDVQIPFEKTDDRCVVAWSASLLSAMRRSQCGHGVFCRDAVAQLEAIVGDITEGRGRSEDLDFLLEVAGGMERMADCALAKDTARQLTDVLAAHRDEWEAHIRRKRCTGGVCPKLESGPGQGDRPEKGTAQGVSASCRDRRTPPVERDKPMRTLECDLAVVAAGPPAGLSAAIAAAEKEASVIVLEKANTTGGAGNMGMGPFAVEIEASEGSADEAHARAGSSRSS